MTVLLRDPDLTIHVGDAFDVLRGMPDGSVDCCVTSPPYWGLRDYGTGSWDGGDADCDHVQRMARGDAGRVSTDDRGGNINPAPVETPIGFRDVCGKCGARRVDQQLGLEPTPDEYVTNMVAVFREVRRVLADHGTLWLNLGDSYWNGGAEKRDGGHGFVDGGKTKLDAAKGSLLAPKMEPVPGWKPKDLCGIPWRVAFALQADGWYLRSDIIWAKPNPMPESVTDRPTKAHEYVFLLSKRPRYWFDQEAVREPNCSPEQLAHNLRYARSYANGSEAHKMPGVLNSPDRHATSVVGRNARSVWEIATQPYPDAHFATFPEELPRRCILAGCPEWVCGTCGKARERIVDVSPMEIDRSDRTHALGHTRSSGTMTKPRESSTVGWSDCRHGNFRPGVVLDPFLGSGTTALVARNHGRSCAGIELNPTYAELAARRLQQLSLLAVPA